MSDSFALVDQLAANPESAFDALIDQFLANQEYARLFEARLMKRRWQLGLPLMNNAAGDAPAETRAAYDASVVEAAREAGGLFLADGQTARAWPYFRAIGEPAPVRERIDAMAPDSGDDGVIEIALHEQVHPRKGFEMLLAQHGICRAITLFDQYPDAPTRGAALELLVRTLHRDLAANLRRAVEGAEGEAPEPAAIPDLLRDWMFGEYDYFIDVSHLGSVVRYSVESADPAVLRLALELTAYGRRLSPELRYKGDPPFDELYHDHAVYLRALLGEDVEGCIAHFLARIASYDYEQIGTYPAQVVVKMLVRLGRLGEAVETYERFCSEADRMYLHCPPLDQLCLLAGDYDRLKRMAMADGDPLRYLAAGLQGQPATPRSPRSDGGSGVEFLS